MAVPGRQSLQPFSLTTSAGSEEDVQIFCQPCDRNGPRLPAFGYCTDCEDHLCQACFNGHRNIKPCRNHTLLDKDSMPKSQSLSANSGSRGHSEELTKQCPRHMKKCIEFYCHDHEALLCSVCVTLEHSPNFCKVNYIPDISGQTVNSVEYNDTMKDMDVLLNRCQNVIMETNSAIEKSNSSLSNALKDLKEYRQEINKMFDDMETKVEDKAKALEQENDSRLKTTTTLCDDIFQSMKVLYDSVKQLNVSKKGEKLFVELKTAQKILQQNESCLNDLSAVTCNITDYHFEPDKSIAGCLEDKTRLGMLTPKCDKKSGGTVTPKQVSSSTTAKQTSQKPRGTESVTLQPPDQGDINIKTPEDEQQCLITGMALVSPNCLVLADRNNACIKVVDVNSKRIISRLALSSQPWDVTPVGAIEVAVTLPAQQTIQFISYNSHPPKKHRRLKVAGKCSGISYYDMKLVVTYRDPGKLEILDMFGAVLNTVSKNQSGKNIFILPDYVIASSYSIYVSVMDTVIMVNWKGEVTGKCLEFEWAKGLALTKKGTIFVSNENRNIIEMSDDFTNTKVVAKDLISPQAICWSDDRQLLYVSSSSGEVTSINTIHVIKVT